MACEIVHARLQLARGDVAGAAVTLAEAEQDAHAHHFAQQLPEIAAARVLVLLRQGHLTTAAELAQAHDLPLSQARVLLAQGDPAAALALLEPLRRRAQERRWVDEQLSTTMLAALAQHAAGESGQAMDMLAEALALAEPGGLLRVFVDEGVPMARLLREALAHGVSPDLVRRLLAAFPVESPPRVGAATAHLAESLTQRELEVLALVAEGLSNQAIAGRLVLSVHTVKVHARNINGKFGVSNRTQAVARARLQPPVTHLTGSREVVPAIPPSGYAATPAAGPC